MIFPIADAPEAHIKFVDTWHAPRSGGRLHQGTDILATRGSPVLAVEDGRVEFGTDPLGGIVARVYSTAGTRYYYAHLDSVTGTNRQVFEGEEIGRVGMTGNAQGTVPHVHFEVHPGGGDAVNPFPLLQAAQRLPAPRAAPAAPPVLVTSEPPTSFSWGKALAFAAGVAGAAWWWSSRKTSHLARANPTLDDISIHDVSRWGDIPGIGYIDGGALVTYHVTDDPARAAKILSKPGVRLMASYGRAGKTSELGSGLYVSGTPSYWVSRARGKWDFLKRLTATQTERLIVELESEIEESAAHGNLTRREHEVARRDLDLVSHGVYGPNALVTFAGPPYSIAFWREEYLRPLGIEPGRAPRVLEIRIRGKFAEIRRHYEPNIFRMLRRAGVAGAFTRASMATNPELVIWDSRAIVSVREVR